MGSATVLILHRDAGRADRPLAACLASVRQELADVHAAGFLDAGADDVRVVAEAPDDTPFGARLRRLTAGVGDGLVVLGSGAMPLATIGDRARFVEVAASGGNLALANDRYSADVVALGRAGILAEIPDLETDNALPRWLEERAGVRVTDLRSRWRLSVDLDTPLDVVLVARHRVAPVAIRSAASGIAASSPRLGACLGAVRDVLADRRAEVLVAGRTSSRSLRWLETNSAARVRALVEERGLRAASALAIGERGGRPPRPPRPPVSALGMLLERDGPGALGSILARLGDAAIVDTRVLLAHRLGSDEARWPSDEDRFASDLLRPEDVADPWLRDLTASAVTAPIPVLLGGHTLVGPGVRLVALAPA